MVQLVKNPLAMRETWVRSLGWKDPLEKGKAVHSTILAWRIPWIIVHGAAKNWTRLSNFHSGRYVKELTDYWGFPSSSDSKASACNAGDLGSIPGREGPCSGRCPGEGSGTPLQYSCLENSMERGAWWATVHGVVKSWTRLSD